MVETHLLTDGSQGPCPFLLWALEQMHFHGHLPLLSCSTQSSGPSVAHGVFRPLLFGTHSGILTRPRHPPPRTHGGPGLLFSGPVLNNQWSCSLEWKPCPNTHTHTHTHTPPCWLKLRSVPFSRMGGTVFDWVTTLYRPLWIAEKKIKLTGEFIKWSLS